MESSARRWLAVALGVLVWTGLQGPRPTHGQVPSPADMAGTWSGDMAIMDASIPFSVHLSVEDETLAGTLDTQGMTGLELDVSYEGATIRLERSTAAGSLTFSGEVQGDSITGVVTQGPVEGTFSLARQTYSGAVSDEAATRPAAPPPTPGDGTGRLTPCRPPGLGVDVLCGSYGVPEDRTREGGRTIDLNMVVLPATGAEVDSVPVVILAGGPGGAATMMAPAIGLQLPDLRRHFDVILVDQRGTGGSNPLQCPYADVDELARAILQVDFDAEALDACREALNADLTRYTTDIAMDDLAEVVHALGHRRINVYGMSYGTRAALVLARRHPALVRTLTLQGVAPLSLKLPMDVAGDAQAALDGVFQDCAADPACAETYPELARKLEEVLQRLEEEPVTVEVSDPVTGRPGTLEITEDIFTGGIRSLLYASVFIQALPRLVDSAHSRDFQPFAETLVPFLQAFGQSLYMGAYLSVVCTEDVPFADPEEAQARARGTFLGDRMVRHHMDACHDWPRGSLPAGFSDPVRSPVPALLISGASDPVTPSHWAAAAAQYLPDNLQIVVPRAGHADSVGRCEQAIMAAFMTSGSATDLDLSCVAEGRTRTYVSSGG